MIQRADKCMRIHSMSLITRYHWIPLVTPLCRSLFSAGARSLGARKNSKPPTAADKEIVDQEVWNWQVLCD